MAIDGVETAGEAGGRHPGHPGLHTVNEEAGHVVLHIEHVEHDMNDDMGERTKNNTTNENGEQTEIVIENENAEAEAEGIEGTSTETTLNVAVEAAGRTGEEHSELSTANEESGHIVGEEHRARCAHSDEEAGSIVLHVSSDMSEEKKTVKKQVRQEQQKRLRRYQRKTLKSEELSRREEAHPKKRNSA